MDDIADVLKSMMGMIGKPIGTNEYPQYHMDYQVASEMNFLRMHYKDLSDDAMRAFEIGNKAETAFEEGNTHEAISMCWKAISLDGRAWDAYRVLIRTLEESIEGDIVTKLAIARELLRLEKEMFKEILDCENADFYKYSFGRPYIRLLSTIAGTAEGGHYNNIHVMGFEEILRINRFDNTGVRYHLLMAYLNCLIANETRIEQYGKWPLRTDLDIESLFIEPLLDEEDDGCWGPDYESDSYYAWYQIINKYLKGDKTWADTAKKEDKEHPDLMKVMLNEKQLKCDIRDIMNKDADLNMANHLLFPVLVKVPNLCSDLLKCLRGKSAYKPAQISVAMALYGMQSLDSDWKEKAEAFLNKGRDLMRKGKYREAIDKFTKTINLYTRSIYPSTRVYNSGVNYAVYSNRAQCAAQLKLYDLSRHDCRIALYLKPNIPHIYKVLPFIAEQYRCPKAKRFFIGLSEEAALEHTDDEWKVIANKAIGRLGLKALLGERVGLSDETIAKEAERGIQDMYEPITFTDDEFDTLPWQELSYLENEVE